MAELLCKIPEKFLPFYQRRFDYKERHRENIIEWARHKYQARILLPSDTDSINKYTYLKYLKTYKYFDLKAFEALPENTTLTDLYNSFRNICYTTYVTKGGRGGAKSQQIAQKLIFDALDYPHTILCTREYQKSINDSVYALLVDLITQPYEMDDGTQEPYFLDKFHIKSQEIICLETGARFIFAGLTKSPEGLKSTHKITRCWVEEAEKVTEESWEYLLPTLGRVDAVECQLYISFNPREEKSATYQNFVTQRYQDSIVIHTNYDDNPFCPLQLIRQAQHAKKHNPDLYRYVWEGNPKSVSNAIIFRDKYELKKFDVEFVNGIEVFNNQRIRWYVGLDFGYSTDPVALTLSFIHDFDLYIWGELYAYQLEIDALVPLIEAHFPFIVKNNLRIYADCSRPDIIAHHQVTRYNSDGKVIPALNMEPCLKFKDSVETGIDYLRNFRRIYINDTCPNTLTEFDLYTYKLDKNTGQIAKPITIVDLNNHAIDALRYGHTEHISNPNKGPVFDTEDIVHLSNFYC